MAGDVCPLRLDEDAYYDLNHLRTCTRRHIASQEHPMTSPTQRRHDEIIGRLDALIDAVQSTTARDHLHRLLAEESAAERRDEPVDVTEEPPVGSQVTDMSDDVWERFADGWKLIVYRGSSVDTPGSTGVLWSEVSNYAPLRLTTDADRERVGLPVVAAPDVDPDEALARVAHMAFWGGRVMPSPDSEAWLDVARAVREHIYAEWNRVDVDVAGAQRDAIQAHSDVERLTRERDDVQDLVFGFRARIKAAEAERGAANVRYETQTRRAEQAEADVERLTRERDEEKRRAERWAYRYRAFRLDIGQGCGTRDVLDAIARDKERDARDDERGRDA